MKKIGLIFTLICILVISTLLPVYAAEVCPLAYGTYTGSFDTTVTIPSYTMAHGQYFAAHNFTYKTVYRVSYDLNTGKISSAQILRHEMYASEVQWANALAQALSIGCNSYTASISADKYSVTFNYQTNLVVRYYESAGGPSEDNSLIYNKTKTFTPQTP